MKKILFAILLVGLIISCNKVQEECQECPKDKQEQVAWDLDTTTYDAVSVEDVEDSDSVYNGPTEWIWDGSQYDTLYIGATLRIANIDGDKVYLTMSK